MNRLPVWAWLVVVAAAVVFTGTAIHAGTTVPDVIKMDNPAYQEHTKGIVEFSHKKHITEYGAGCGECHHDADGKPLNDLKEGDDVQGCITCHDKPGELKGKEAKGKTDAEKRQYHANALHDNCQGCHKAFNKKNKTKAAPTTCTKCHPRKSGEKE